MKPWRTTCPTVLAPRWFSLLHLFLFRSATGATGSPLQVYRLLLRCALHPEPRQHRFQPSSSLPGRRSPAASMDQSKSTPSTATSAAGADAMPNPYAFTCELHPRSTRWPSSPLRRSSPSAIPRSSPRRPPLSATTPRHPPPSATTPRYPPPSTSSPSHPPALAPPRTPQRRVGLHDPHRAASRWPRRIRLVLQTARALHHRRR